jgi:hypothetical protein
MATVTAVSLGVLSANPQTGDLLASSASGSISGASGTTDSLERRDATVSRSTSRVLGRKSEKALDSYQRERAEERAAEAAARAVRQADTRLWTTTELNVWSAPAGDAEQTGLIDAMEKVLVTGRRADGRAEIVVNGKSRWVSDDYLAEEKPAEEPALGGSCTNGSTVPSGVHEGIVKVHEAVCANFPSITTYGTFRGDGEHAEGRAVDVMTSGSTGWDIAEFLRANASALGIEYIIYSQNIWSVERSGEGWRSMSDRGSTTANHYDHVHVTVY